MMKTMLNICAFIMLMCWTDTSRAGACCGKEKDNDEKKPILTKQKTHINGEKKEDCSPPKKKKNSKEIIIENTYPLQYAGLNVVVPEGYEKMWDNEKNEVILYPKICHITLLVSYRKSTNKNVTFLLNEEGARPNDEKLLKKKLEVVRQDISQNNQTKTSNNLSICFEKIMNSIIEQKKPVYLARDPKDQSSIILVLEKENQEATALLFETMGIPKKEKKKEDTTSIKKKKKKKSTKKRKKSSNSSSESDNENN
ncbi:MAG: hypothetical protein KBD76_16545 [Bacteriovorax sp.]|nr:hypothetical protein [Bacteriovorax sp.]